FLESKTGSATGSRTSGPGMIRTPAAASRWALRHSRRVRRASETVVFSLRNARPAVPLPASKRPEPSAMATTAPLTHVLRRGVICGESAGRQASILAYIGRAAHRPVRCRRGFDATAGISRLDLRAHRDAVPAPD